MKIRIITNAQIAYTISVESDDIEEITNKILEKKYLKLNENLIVLTSSISEIRKIAEKNA